MLEMKEGGWGWLVTFSSFWVHVITCGIAYSCGILHQFYVSYYDKTHFETSWIVALLLGLSVLAGIPGLIFTYQIGARFTVILGGLVAALGFILSRFVNHMYEVYLCVGGLVGIGFGLALTPSVMIIESYFFKRREFASSLATSGISIGICIFPLVLYELEEHLAWKGMALVLGGICLNITLAGIPMRANSGVAQRRDYVKMFNPSLFKSLAFCAIILCNIIWSVGISIIYTYLPSYIVETKNVVGMDAAVLVAVSGIAGFTSRTIFIVFNQTAKLDHCSTFLCTIVLTGIMTGLFPELFEHKAGAIGYVIILGMHSGYWSTFMGSVMEELIGQECVGFGKGFVIVSIGLGLLAGPPLGGWIYDDTGDWKICFYLAGACLLFSSVVMMGINMKRCYYRPPADWNDSSSESSYGSNRLSKERPQQQLEEEQFIVVQDGIGLKNH